MDMATFSSSNHRSRCILLSERFSPQMLETATSRVTDLSTSAVRCSPFAARNPRKSFLTILFIQWHFIHLFSSIVASLFNKLTYLLTYFYILKKVDVFGTQCSFYRAMLCIRGTSHRPVSVCVCPCLSVSVCLSQVGVLLKRLHTGSHKQHHTIPQRL